MPSGGLEAYYVPAIDRIKEITKMESHSSFAIHLENSFEILRQALAQYPHSLALSFNGGKDATVVLHLTLILMLQYPEKSRPSIVYVYFDNSSPEKAEFPQVLNFISTKGC